MQDAAKKLKATRPTTVNLAWAVDKQLQIVDDKELLIKAKFSAIKKLAQEIADEDAAFCKKIGKYGISIIEEISSRKNGDTVNIFTHCNAGWLAFVDYASAAAPIYKAHNKGIKVHVRVDETRSRNQGARLTAWEIG